ncbi:hypothetical protein EV648_10324 [Kribbella sp. VKM Ac-2568]|nr:hypothetical protein EV648_10324 [Kribbella sp. VKM Ac-2568]
MDPPRRRLFNRAHTTRKPAAINRGPAAGYSTARLRKRSSSDTGRRVPAALSSETTSCVRRSSRSASTKAISATIAVARRSWRARRPWTSSARHLIIRTGEFALAVAVREADGTNTESSPRTDPGPSVARTRPCLRTSTLPSRMAATPSAGSPSSKSVEPAAASLIVVSRMSWSMSSSTTSRNGHTSRIAAGRSAFKRVLPECRWDRRERSQDARAGSLGTTLALILHEMDVASTDRLRALGRRLRVIRIRVDRCVDITGAEPVRERAQRVQPDVRHGLVATASHLHSDRAVTVQVASSLLARGSVASRTSESLPGG